MELIIRGYNDKYGNVWEWVQDKWHENYNSAPEDGTPWELGDNSSRVIRGGCWLSFAGFCRSADRYSYDPVYRFNFLGFRLLR